MDPFDLRNCKSYLSSEQQDEDIFMELDDDSRYDAFNGEEFGSFIQIVYPNVRHEYLCSQSSTTQNNDRKRKSQSTYPFAKKVSRIVRKEQHEPLHMSVRESELLKTSADSPSFTNVVTPPDAKYINEQTSADAPSFNNVVMVPDAKNFKDEFTLIQDLETCESPFRMSLSKDGKSNSKENIFSASRFSEVNVLLEEQNQSIPEQRYSCSYIVYSNSGIIKCEKCGKSFSHLNLFKRHHKKFNS